MRKSFPVCLAAVAMTSMLWLPWAQGAMLQTVTRKLVKVGVEKVLRVSLAKEQPADPKKRLVVLKLAAAYPKCSAGELFSYKEGTLDKVDYYSYWAASSIPCGPGGPVDVDHGITLDVGKTYSFIVRGPGKWDQRVSFRVEADQVASMLTKRVLGQ